MNSAPILILLIHPCWFIDGPALVISWHMTFDHDLKLENMHCWAKGIEIEVHKQIRTEKNAVIKKMKPEALEQGDRFCKRGANLLSLAAYKAIDFHKSIADAHRGEEYTHDYAKVTEKFNKK